MAKKTSIHICAAKYGAEKHNRREKEMKHVHSEYSHLNKSWEAEDFKSVADEIPDFVIVSPKNFHRIGMLFSDDASLALLC